MNDDTNSSSKGSGLNVGMFLGFAVLIVAGVVAFKGLSPAAKTMKTSPTVSSSQNESLPVNGSVEGDETAVGEPKVINVEGGMFYFKPDTITVKKGEKVMITFKNVEGMHDFVIDELNVKSQLVKAGETTTVEFTPQEAGTYEYYCSVSDHRAKGMVGTLVVE